MKNLGFTRRPWHRKPKYEPLTPEEIARAIAETQKKLPPTVQAESVARESSSSRAEIARGKQPIQSVDEDMASEEEIVVPIVKNKVKRDRKRIVLPPPDQLYEILMSMDFTGTRYPHRETLEQLGIFRDVEYLLDMCHLGTFMSFQFEAYKEETCSFLATLEVHFYDHNPEADPKRGLGYITFSAQGRDCSLTTNELNKLYDFPSGTDATKNFNEEELQELWLTIGGQTRFSSARSKNSALRSPVVRYVHKAIASTLFARNVTGNINNEELEMLDWALSGILDSTRAGTELRGNRADTSLIFVLLDHLLGYKEWAFSLYNQGKKGMLCVGGIVTPILVACDLNLDFSEYPPRWMDIKYLTKSAFLDGKMVNGQHLYKFFHPATGSPTTTPLPCPSQTTITMGNNIDFWPPAEAPFAEPRKDIPQEEAQPEQVESDTDGSLEIPLEEFQGNTLNDAHTHIRKLRRWSIKTIKALQKTVSVMGKQIKELQGKPKAAPPTPPITGLSILRRSGSTSIAPRRNIPMEPPRISSFEPRQRPLGAEEQRGMYSTGLLDQHLPQRNWRIQGPSSMSQADFHIGSDALAPAYTQESMEKSIDSFFSQP